MTNILEQAIKCDDGDRAARIIMDALGIETDEVANYCLPQYRPTAREQRAAIIGNWLQAEAEFLA
jgi:uncharacterized protein HemY